MNSWGKDKTLSIVQEVCRRIDSLHNLSQNKQKTIVRFPVSPNHSVIVKFWSRSTIKNKFRKCLGSAPAFNEWKFLHFFNKIGIAVPKPIGVCHVPTQFKPFTEVLIIEDLDISFDLTHHIITLVHTGNEEELSTIEENLIQITATMIQNNILDPDHGLINCIMTKKNQLYRIDLELTRKVFFPKLHVGLYAKTLGKLLVTYTYAVQPETIRTTNFAQKLLKKINPPRLVLKYTKSYFQKCMEKQRLYNAIDNSNISLPW